MELGHKSLALLAIVAAGIVERFEERPTLSEPTAPEIELKGVDGIAVKVQRNADPVFSGSASYSLNCRS